MLRKRARAHFGTDEGVERCMDVFQQDGGINTLLIATFTYGRGIAGRQVPGQPLPDHGKF